MSHSEPDVKGQTGSAEQTGRSGPVIDPKQGKRVLVAMSGGVDSSVAAVLLIQAGYAVTGVTLKLFDRADEDEVVARSCCSLESIDDARRVCHLLGIEHHVFNKVKAFGQTVIAPFAEAYRQGLTPNPCVECNRSIKFAELLSQARAYGFDYIATGHYIRKIEDPVTGLFHVHRGIDEQKDQSYALYMLAQEQLAHVLFPLGDLTKPEVRRIAADNGLRVHNKPDSQEICFVDGRYTEFLRQDSGIAATPGPMIDPEGKVVGQHTGIIDYTVGQRKGLGAFGQPMFVLAKDAAANRLVIGPPDALFNDYLLADKANWIVPVPSGSHISAKIRYSAKPAPCRVEYDPNDPAGVLKVIFDAPQRAITPGQLVVFYRDDEMLGGATIRTGPTDRPA